MQFYLRTILFTLHFINFNPVHLPFNTNSNPISWMKQSQTTIAFRWSPVSSFQSSADTISGIERQCNITVKNQSFQSQICLTPLTLVSSVRTALFLTSWEMFWGLRLGNVIMFQGSQDHSQIQWFNRRSYRTQHIVVFTDEFTRAKGCTIRSAREKCTGI